MTETSVFELKITNNLALPFDAVKPHQIINLKIAKHGTLPYKIADEGFQQKPFDCVVLRGTPAYVVVMYYQRGQKKFYLIDVDVFTRETQNSDRKSLTEARAREIGITCAFP